MRGPGRKACSELGDRRGEDGATDPYDEHLDAYHREDEPHQVSPMKRGAFAIGFITAKKAMNTVVKWLAASSILSAA